MQGQAKDLTSKAKGFISKAKELNSNARAKDTTFENKAKDIIYCHSKYLETKAMTSISGHRM